MLVKNVVALRQASETALDNLTFYALAIAIGSLVAVNQNLDDYEGNLTRHVPLFSAFMLLTAATLNYSLLRRKIWRLFLVAIVCVLSGLVSLARLMNHGIFAYNVGDNVVTFSMEGDNATWEELCNRRTILESNFRIFEMAISGLMLWNIFVFSCHDLIRYWISKTRRNNQGNRKLPIWSRIMLSLFLGIWGWPFSVFTFFCLLMT
jgi:hypothetical protein